VLWDVTVTTNSRHKNLTDDHPPTRQQIERCIRSTSSHPTTSPDGARPVDLARSPGPGTQEVAFTGDVVGVRKLMIDADRQLTDLGREIGRRPAGSASS